MNPRYAYAGLLLCAALTLWVFLMLAIVRFVPRDQGALLLVTIALAPITAMAVVSGVDFVAWHVSRESQQDAVGDDAV